MIQLPTEPKVVSQEGDSKASFEISPLYPGYGMTVGNTLRRVLLSSLEGTAITSVKIDGVAHEFSTIPNVLEDVVDIILNLKKVRFKIAGEGPVKITLSAKGEGKVTAGDIKATAEVEVINKNQHIATLTDKKAELNMEIDLERGIGYIPVEQRQKEKIAVGVIAVDAIFNPVRMVNFKVENIRVGQRTDFNKLVMEIETDGSMTPQEAINKAAELVVQHFQLIKTEVPVIEIKPAKKPRKAAEKEEGKEEKPKKKPARGGSASGGKK